MTRELVRLQPSTSADDVVAAMKRDGAAIVEGMVPPDVIDAFLEDVLPLIEASPVGEPQFTGVRTRRCGGLMGKSFHTAPMLTHPLLIGAAEQVLVKEQPYIWWNDAVERVMYPKLQLSVTQAIQILPGERAQPLHRDDGVHHRKHPGPETQVQIMYALTDFTEANGGTRVIPGSHLWEASRRPDPREAVSAAMPRGSGLFFFGSAFHGGGANASTDQQRIGVTISLIPGHLRQEENQYLAVPIEIVKRYPPDVQALLGYVISPPACGFVDLVDPIVLLQR